MQLNQMARGYIDQYSQKQGEFFGVTDPSKQFAITGPKENQLRAKLLESTDFLKRITVLDVDQKTGQVVNVGLNRLHTGRKKGGRHTTATGIDGHEYDLVEIDSCAIVTWDTLSVWANSGNVGQFMQLMNNNATQSFGLDMLRIGFNGLSVAETTNPVENPNGEDVTLGWQALVTRDAPTQIITQDTYLDNEGAGDYKTLDAMASDLINTKIHPSLRNHPNLVVLVGADLMSYEQARLYDEATTPTEKKAAQQLPHSIAGRPAMVPPFMPGKRMIVTTLDNLHIYTQRNTRHRKAEHVEDRKQHENSYLRWEGYAIGEYEAYASIDESKLHFGAAPVEEAA